MKSLIVKTGLVDAVRGIITFRFLSQAEILDLLDRSDAIEYDEGEVVVKEGETGACFYGIAEGSLAVSVGEGRQVYVGTLGAGDVFGESGLFMSVPRTATVTAQCHAVILRVSRGALSGFLERHPASGNKILLVFIYNLLRKLNVSNQELAYERKSDMAQADVDAMVESIFGGKE
jgi:CRP/FNR family transcriptional regulator, cyclic AMP receptor protein